MTHQPPLTNQRTPEQLEARLAEVRAKPLISYRMYGFNKEIISRLETHGVRTVGELVDDFLDQPSGATKFGEVAGQTSYRSIRLGLEKLFRREVLPTWESLEIEEIDFEPEMVQESEDSRPVIDLPKNFPRAPEVEESDLSGYSYDTSEEMEAARGVMIEILSRDGSTRAFWQSVPAKTEHAFHNISTDLFTLSKEFTMAIKEEKMDSVGKILQLPITSLEKDLSLSQEDYFLLRAAFEMKNLYLPKREELREDQPVLQQVLVGIPKS